MTKSLAVIGLTKLLDSVEADLRETEPYSDNLDRFRALLWLESPDRTYVTDASGLCLIDTNTAFAFFIKELQNKLTAFASSREKSTVTAKLILVICELISLMPVQNTSADITANLEKMSQMQLDEVSLAAAWKCVGKALRGAVRMAVMAGSNPMRTILAGQSNTPVEKLKKVRGLAWSSVTVTYLLDVIPSLVPDVAIDQKVEFLTSLVGIFDQFSSEVPSQHAEMVRNGVPLAQKAVECILKLKGGLEIEGAAVICYLIPMCHAGLEAIGASKKAKTNPFGNTFSVVNEAKKGKKGSRELVAFAFMHLYAAKIIGGPSKEGLFAPISQFLTKSMAKWEKKILKPKMEIVPSIHGRLAALKHAAGVASADNLPLTMIVDHAKDGEVPAWQAIGEFLTRLGKGWPIPGTVMNLNAAIFRQAVTKLSEILGAIKLGERNAENAPLTDIASVLLEFLAKMERDELLFSVASVQDDATPCPRSDPMTMLLSTCAMHDTTAQLAKTILSCFTSKALLDHEVQSLVNFLRSYWKVDPGCFDGVTCEQILGIVMKFVENFMAQSDFCVKQNSPNLCLLPALFYRFLKWTYCGLAKTYQESATKLPRNFVLYASKTCFLLRAFTGDAILNHVESMITTIAALFGETNPYIFPMQNISSDDSSMKEWTQTAVSVWFAFVKQRFKLDNVTTPVKQLIATEPQWDPTRERIGVVTGFLAQVIHYLSDRGIPDTEVKSLPRYFFTTVYNYLLNSTSVDSVFPVSFVNLPVCSYQTFLDILKEKLTPKAQNCHWERPFPYLIFIDTVAEICKKDQLDAYSVSIIEELIPMFFSIVQFGVFERQKVQFVTSLSSLVAAFYETKTPKSQLVQASTIQTVMELAVTYGVSKDESPELVVVTMKALCSIFRDYVADISMSRPHIVKASAETRTVNQFSFVVGALDAILTANQNEELWTLTQQILNSILRNNAVLAWRLYVIVAKRARTVFRSLIIASLTLLCGMGYESVWEINSVKESPAAAAPRRRSSHHDSIGVDGFLTSARHKVQPEQPFVFKKEDELFDWITENNFQLFKEPPTTNPYFMDSAIGCAIIFNQHNELFEEMAKLATVETLKGTNPVTRFFAAFFRRMMSKMSMCAIIEACDPENLGPFFEAFMPRPQFTYYLGRLVQLTDRDRAETILQLYLRELLERPWIVSGTKLLTPAERDAFMMRLTNCYEYKATFQSMLSAEMVYPKLNIKTFSVDRQIVLSFIGKNPMSFDRSLGELFDENLNARQLVSLNQSNWVMDIGKMASGARGILITVGNVPKIPFEAAASQFYLHFKDDTEQLEFFVDAAMPTSSSLGIFREILKQAPNNFMNRINHITVVNLSPPVVEMLNSSFPSVSPEIKAKVRFSSDLEKLLELDDHVSLPMAALRGIDERRGIIPVRVDAKDSQLIIGFDSLLITTNMICMMKPSESVRSISFNIIDGFDELKDGSGVVINAKSKKAGGKDRPGGTVKLVTGKSSNIVHALKIIRNRVHTRKPWTQADVTSSVSQSFRVEMIAFALFLIARHSATLQTQAIQLFEAAMRSGDPAWNCEVSKINKVILNLEHFFDEVSKLDIYEEVMVSLSSYIAEEPEICLPKLLPFFATFMNRSDNMAYLSSVASQVTIGAKLDVLIPEIERHFFGALTSKKAVEAAIPVVMKAGLDKVATRSIIQVLLHSSDEVVAKIVVEQFLDGALRRRSFGALLQPEQLFSLLPSLAFACPALVNVDIARLLFCAVMGSCHVYEAVPDIRLFLQGVFATLLLTRKDIENDILKYNKRISKMLENPKVMDQLNLIMTVDKFTEILGSEYHNEYRRLLTEVELDDNPNIYYLKAVAMVHLGQGTPVIGNKLARRLKFMYEDENLGAQKLALLFSSLADVIDSYPTDSLVPICLMWLPLVCLGNRNTRLRQASCKLLCRVFDFSMKNGGFYDFNGLLTSQYISQGIVDALDSLEKSLMVKFTSNFNNALVTILMRSLEEVETRASAIELLKCCIAARPYDQVSTIAFVLPMVAFGTNADLQWVLSNIQTECTTIPELIFHDFSSNKARESAWIVSFLCGMFGERHCSHSTEVIADAVIYGIKCHPMFFEGLRTMMVEKCWKMIDTEESITRIERIAAVSAAFLGIADSGVDCGADIKPMKVIHIGDDSMKKTLTIALEGVDRAIRYVTS